MMISKGEQIGQYIFEEQIGKGGQSCVYRVHSIKFNYDFAAKVIPNENLAKSTEDEGITLIRLDHPNIIRIYDIFDYNNCRFLILDLCNKGSLLQEIAHNGPLEYSRFLCIAREIIDALNYLHSQNVAHRDIKPGNILLDDRGHAKLVDFGLSLRSSGDCSKFDGSLIFAPPEILKHKCHNPIQGDIWSLGVTFAYLLIGRSPWPADSEEMKAAINLGLFAIPPCIPDEMRTIIRKMLNLVPAARPTAEQLSQIPLFQKPSMRTASLRSFPSTLNNSFLTKSRTVLHQTVKKDHDSLVSVTKCCRMKMHPRLITKSTFSLPQLKPTFD